MALLSLRFPLVLVVFLVIRILPERTPNISRYTVWHRERLCLPSVYKRQNSRFCLVRGNTSLMKKQTAEVRLERKLFPPTHYDQPKTKRKLPAAWPRSISGFHTWS